MSQSPWTSCPVSTWKAFPTETAPSTPSRMGLSLHTHWSEELCASRYSCWSVVQITVASVFQCQHVICCMCLQGFSSAMSGFVKLGLINTEPCPLLGHTASPLSWVSIWLFFLHNFHKKKIFNKYILIHDGKKNTRLEFYNKGPEHLNSVYLTSRPTHSHILSVFLFNITVSGTQKELLCKLIGLSTTLSSSAFEDAVYEQIGRDDFRMQSLRRWVEEFSLPLQCLLLSIRGA